MELVLQRADLLGEPFDLLGDLLGRGAQQRADAPQQLLFLLDVLERAVAGDRLDAAQVRADRALAHDLDRADEAERVHVRAAAQLGRRAGFEHAHDLAVLLAEERDRADAFGLGLRGLVVAHRRVGDHLLVGEPLDLRELLGRDRVVMAEVEAQPIGRHHRAGLLHVRAEHLAQRPVQDVGGGVVAADAVAAHGVDRGFHLVADLDRAAADHALVHDHRTGHAVARVLHVEHGAVDLRDPARVADLAARLRVEGRAVEHDFHGSRLRPLR